MIFPKIFNNLTTLIKHYYYLYLIQPHIKDYNILLQSNHSLVKEIEQLIANRKSLRKQRDFAAADQIRTDLDARGILLEDDSTGTRWKRK